MKEQISSQEWILLSSYLDGELNPREKTRVEALLRSRPEIHAAYQSLVRTKSVLQRTPRKSVPRNFTLSVEYSRQPHRSLRLIPVLRLSSAVAAFMSVFLVLSQLIPAFSPAVNRLVSPDMALQPMQEESAVMEFAPAFAEPAPIQEPPMVFWGGPPFVPQGGMGGAAVGSIPGDMVREGGYEPPIVIQPQAEKAIEVPQTLPEIARQPGEEEPLTGSGPILGVREPQEQGKVLDSPTDQRMLVTGDADVFAIESEPTTPLGIPIGYVGAIVLGTLAAAFMVTALILKKASRL